MAHQDHRRAAPRDCSVALLTVSDTRSPGTDESGSIAEKLILDAGHRVFERLILPDEPERVRNQVAHWLEEPGCDAVITCGGTGISSRDRTYEALRGLLDRRLDGFGELFRRLSYEEIGSAAMLSRAIGGIASGRPVFAVPGSPGAVRLALERLILPEIGHLLAELRKER